MADGNGKLKAVEEALRILKQDKRPLDLKEAKRLELKFAVQNFLNSGGKREEITEAVKILGL